MIEAIKKRRGIFVFLREMKKNWQLYSMGIPVIVLLGIFNYWPMFGLVIAFKNFKFKYGIFGSDWMSPIWANFKILFNSSYAITAVKNTIFLNLIFIVTGTICAVLLALMLNEVRHSWYKKITQSITFLPFFISWVVVGLFIRELLSLQNGVVNRIIASLGFEKINFFTTAKVWPPVLTIIKIWKGVGYGAVVYLATLSGIDPVYYEAAEIDGATRMQRICNISIPLLRPTIIILTLLSLGKIMNADFGLFYNVTGGYSSLWETTDVIDTFIFRALKKTGDIKISSAAGFFQSVVSLTMVIIFNTLARHIDRDSALF